jgi:hypothetical protein
MKLIGTSSTIDIKSRFGVQGPEWKYLMQINIEQITKI